MKLDRPVSSDRIPRPSERATETVVGDQALMLGHPRLIPLKAEIQPVTTYTGSNVRGPFNALHGNSGSGIVNLNTGKLIGIARTGPMDLEPSTHPTCQMAPRYDLIFGARDVGAQGALPLASVIPPIGLQVSPTLAVDHYGPPTDAEDWAGVEARLTVPATQPGQAGSRAVDWRFEHEGIIVMMDVEGPTSGHLEPGDPAATLQLKPKEFLLAGQGLWTALTALFDDTYGTRTPLKHQLHVGLDGYLVNPTDPFDGQYGLGVHHGAARTHSVRNRWIVEQDLTVDATTDPEDPNAPWPQWLKLAGDTVPVPLTLPPTRTATLQAVADGTGLLPGTYTGWVRFRSEDSGEPPYEMTRKVYFDHCREIFEDLDVPVTLTLPPFGGEDSEALTVAPTGVTIIDDVDVISQLTVDLLSCGIHSGCPYGVRLVAPDGFSVLLKDEEDAPQIVYDKQTGRDAAGFLDNFNGHGSPGTWTLIAKNAEDATEPLELTLHALHVRLHHDNALACEP